MLHSRSPWPVEATPAARHAPPYLDRCPRLVAVSGHPVLVAPELDTNCFYLDSGYWLLSADGVWRHSVAFDGPWRRVDPDHMPVALLRLPRSAYRAPPPCLDTGPPYRPPRWDLIWGEDWARRHAGWAHRSEPLSARPPPVPRPPAQQVQELRRSPRRPPYGEAGENGDSGPGDD